MLLPLFILQFNNYSFSQRNSNNVILITIDDLRTDLSTVNNIISVTPNLDKLCSISHCFKNAYCNFPLCNPSRSSYLTGLRPDSIRVWDNQTNFRNTRPETQTLPQLFKQSGYLSLGAGKVFHINDRISWNEYYAPPSKFLNRKNREALLPNAYENEDVGPFKYRDGRITHWVLNKIDSIKDEKFFLGIGFRNPHLPYLSPKYIYEKFDTMQFSIESKPHENWSEFATLNAEKAGLENYVQFNSFYQLDTQIELKKQYFSAVSYIDELIGLLVNKLKEVQLFDKTIIVIISDHGYKLGEFSLWSKWTLLNIDNKIPMIIHLPNQNHPVIVNEFVELIDLYPTILDLSEIPFNKDQVDGTSIFDGSSILSSKKQSIITQVLRNHTTSSGKVQRVMGYALIDSTTRKTAWIDFDTKALIDQEYFDRSSDPIEAINLRCWPIPLTKDKINTQNDFWGAIGLDALNSISTKSETWSSINICEGDIHVFGSMQLSSPGEYTQYYNTKNNCDSIAHLSLQFNNCLITQLNSSDKSKDLNWLINENNELIIRFNKMFSGTIVTCDLTGKEKDCTRMYDSKEVIFQNYFMKTIFILKIYDQLGGFSTFKILKY